jgi:predicted Rossmann fold nucleotide-binding protein DprA/Smf involved in DNA uptake
MNITVQTQAVLLLTAHFSKPEKDAPRPLAPTEWGRFACWLKDRDVSPGTLLTGNFDTLLNEWTDRTITLERIRYLLGRAGALGLALEKWQRAGLWILTRSDADYPTRLKKHLKNDSPPLLFGCGSRNLLNRGGIGVVGSRDASAEDLAFTTRLGQAAARQGLSIVSGGARGVDETAMLGALECEGTAIGIVADNLLRSATSAKYRKALMTNSLVLISPFNPEAGFDVGNAMARNKYIYCLCDAAIVITSTQGKGGTWNGATENLKNHWTPLWVKSHHDKDSGNAGLVRQGARWLPEGEIDLVDLISTGVSSWHEQVKCLPVLDQLKPGSQDLGLFAATYADIPIKAGSVREELVELKADTKADEGSNAFNGGETSFYDLFLQRFKALAARLPLTAEELLGHLDVNKTQLNDWLKRAVEEGEVEKLNKPVRYRPKCIVPKQESMFADTARIIPKDIT